MKRKQKIADVFEYALKRNDIPYKLEFVNNDKCIDISSDDDMCDLDDMLKFWVRIMDGNRYSVDLSTIQLPRYKRRRGILSEIFDKLCGLGFIDVIGITGVSTEEMRKWCIKHNLETTNDSEYYKKFS